MQVNWEKKSSRRLKPLYCYNYSSNVLIIRKTTTTKTQNKIILSLLNEIKTPHCVGVKLSTFKL